MNEVVWKAVWMASVVKLQNEGTWESGMNALYLFCHKQARQGYWQNPCLKMSQQFLCDWRRQRSCWRWGYLNSLSFMFQPSPNQQALFSLTSSCIFAYPIISNHFELLYFINNNNILLYGMDGKCREIQTHGIIDILHLVEWINESIRFLFFARKQLALMMMTVVVEKESSNN